MSKLLLIKENVVIFTIEKQIGDFSVPEMGIEYDFYMFDDSNLFEVGETFSGDLWSFRNSKQNIQNDIMSNSTITEDFLSTFENVNN